MYKLLLLFFTYVSLVYGANPKAYASLGNKIYDNVNNIQNLTKIGDYYLYVDEINDYIRRVRIAKEKGFQLEKESSLQERNNYLKTLRKLAQDNDYYTRMAKTSLENAIKNGDSLLFSKIINSGLIDTKANKKRILDYYFAHKKDINATGIIQHYLDEDRALQRAQEEKNRLKLSKAQREALKIKRLRLRDKKRQEALEKKLDAAVKEKKLEIREEQKKELLKSI